MPREAKDGPSRMKQLDIVILTSICQDKQIHVFPPKMELAMLMA